MTGLYASGIVDPDVYKFHIGDTDECDLRTGSSIQYDLPFQLQVTAFSFGVSTCGAEHLLDWAFEAFDGEEWRQLYYCAHSPWPGGNYNARAHPVIFRQLGDAGASARFRIRLMPLQSQRPFRCMHIRGLELYGTIMPPWRID